MGSIWCPAPEEVKLELSFVDDNAVEHPFWIRIKRRLNVGEERGVMTAGWRGVSGNRANNDGATEITIDWTAQSFARTMAYLRDWSLRDDQDRPLKIGVDVVRALDSRVYAAIEAGISAHIEEMNAEKKVTSGEPKPEEMSA